ncbi:MAG TPA: RNA polymerase factor sigma-54 [Nevskiaceae bacterium]|nr:RNA polymerase factor sigma-54 [Nevskiaceae bacterium]
MKPALHLHTGQHMTMTPQLLQSIRLLQLSSLELEQELRQALEKNVMLEEAEEEEEESAAELAQEEAAPLKATQEDAAVEVAGDDPAAAQKVEIDYDATNSEAWSGGEPPDEEGESLEARTAAPQSADARVQALAQLELVVSSRREAALVGAIVEAIDDNGYLEQLLDEIRAQLPEELGATAAEMEAALALVQGVEPTGFGARTLSECLLLQIRALPAATPGRDVAEYIASACLERLAGGDLKEVRELLGVDAQAMTQAVDLILSLNPKPGASLGSPAQAVVPDLIVSDHRGSWKVELNPANLPRVRINGTYERMLSGVAHRAMRDQLAEARWLVRGIEMRNDTLLKTARVIFERQRGFLARGEEGMAPLNLREVADAIAMHESTVCRVTTNKYVQTPWGVYELKAFFPSHISGAAGETSGTAVKAMIRRIIDTEGRRQPLCDGDIAAILLRNGVHVARRTVAKYREAMKIAPAKERRTRGQRAEQRMAV